MKNLYISLKPLSLKIVNAIAIGIMVTYECGAQSFTILPNDSIVANGSMDVETFYNIIQKDNSPDTLLLHWEKVSAVVPDQWLAVICDNNLCYSGLIQGATMDTVSPAQDGLLSVHLTPYANAGTAIIRYAVWDINYPALKDTLTWIITTWQTGISSLDPNSTLIFASGNELVIKKNDPQLTNIRVCNLEGRALLESSITSDKMSFDVSSFPTGIYFVEAIGANSIVTRKVLIQ